MQQTIFPDRQLFFAGETVEFTLFTNNKVSGGTAWLRTNITGAARHRNELIEEVEKKRKPAELDWKDLPMKDCGNGCWKLAIPLLEVGVFEAKCCFKPEKDSVMSWASGRNFHLKVSPAESAGSNGIYSVFVRQFGRYCTLKTSPPEPAAAAALDAAGYTVIPPSGTFRDVIRHLDHIFDRLGCGILQLLPIHPAPVQYGRMGRFGSPFAATDYFNVDPALAEFDKKATPMEQFGELVDAVHARGGRIFLDIPVNHTGWASKLQTDHPEYFVRQPDGTFESPGAWGVVWEDLCRLDYSNHGVHHLMAGVFLYWCARGVDGFRCDAGYMLPEKAWNYIVAKVRREYPDTVFLLEGLGGPLDVQEKLLRDSGLDWAYSELFQCYDRSSIEHHYPYMASVSAGCGTLVNFAETHDNLRLAATSEVYAKLRFMTAALLANGGTFGFANGAEFFATERIDVHGAGALNYGAEPNLADTVKRLNVILDTLPQFAPESSVSLITSGGGNTLAALRTSAAGEKALILFNFDCENPVDVYWDAVDLPPAAYDIFTGADTDLARNSFHLAPGEVRAFVFDRRQLPPAELGNFRPERQFLFRAELMARRAVAAIAGTDKAAERSYARAMLNDPEGFIRELSGNRLLAPLVRWRSWCDSKRQLMLTPGDLLLLESKESFRCSIREPDGSNIISVTSLETADGRHFAIAVLPSYRGSEREHHLDIHYYGYPAGARARRCSGKIVILPERKRRFTESFNTTPFTENDQLFAFGTNDIGGYIFCRAPWGEITSKYEALLAANPSKDYPADRRILFSRCRVFLVSDSYSHELGSDSMTGFSAGCGNRAVWNFTVPSGQGTRTPLDITMEFSTDANAVRLSFHRPDLPPKPGEKRPEESIRIILRPDLENRCNHEVTKAYTGAEKEFPAATHASNRGFTFTPGGSYLQMTIDRGCFHCDTEWHYMIDLPAERLYGLEDKTDHFSPGYFEFELKGGDSAVLSATADRQPEKTYSWPEEQLPRRNAGNTLFPESALRRYVVKRDNFHTIIAGYPWFLDWGRDTFIALRGLVKHQAFRKEAEGIFLRFARYEENGTLPNIICGSTVGNRDTSDAPLWFILAVKEFTESVGSTALLEQECGNGRTLKDVLLSIINGYRNGTPNGIKEDPESKLIFSPAHFTWMDTNYPAGTPREGYPVEIQSLWYSALDFLGFREEAAEVSRSISKYFFTVDKKHCSDCLHCPPGTPASLAVPDDHNRPNQLFAVTLKALRSPEEIRAIIDDTALLLVPGAIRTLDDVDVKFRLPVMRNGELLNNPIHPYCGRYEGPEDTSRKTAYHNGTAWCWPFPSFCEALAMTGERKRARILLESAHRYLSGGVPGALPEVADGDAPHRPGGCMAQAWSITEFYRVGSELID